MTAVASARSQSRGRRHQARPHYQPLALGLPGQGLRPSIWQVPGARPLRAWLPPNAWVLCTARTFDSVEVRLTRRLDEAGICIGRVPPDETPAPNLEQDYALVLTMLFRTLVLMCSLERTRTVAEGIDCMSREEAANWLGMPIRCKEPRRMLASLHLLLSAT